MALMRSFSIRIGLFLALVLGGFSAAIPAAEVDLPARIGRIGLISGTVETWSPGDKGWAVASLNTPVSSGWAMWADRDARAEVRIGSASVHLAPDSQVNFSRIDDSVVAIEAARGSVRVRVRSLGEGDRFLLNTDGLQIEVRQPGDFRLDFDPSHRRATLRVFSGRAQILGFGDRMLLMGGQQAQIDTASRQLLSLGELTRNEFDAWAENRNREQDRLQSARYVSPEMTGIEALDEHGRWDNDPIYGAIWYPRVVVGWAPYRFGHWSWIGPWGWTWIDDAPWGFAPFHYGRWMDINGRWGWLPGSRVPHPVYAPALVGFYGGGPRVGVNVSIGIGNIGWFPLGPTEVYRPAYAYSPGYLRRVNTPHFRNERDFNRGVGRDGANESYRYAHRPDAATVVPSAVFSGARPVGPAVQRVDRGQIGRLPVAGRPELPGGEGARAPGSSSRMPLPPTPQSPRGIDALARRDARERSRDDAPGVQRAPEGALPTPRPQTFRVQPGRDAAPAAPAVQGPSNREHRSIEATPLPNRQQRSNETVPVRQLPAARLQQDSHPQGNVIPQVRSPQSVDASVMRGGGRRAVENQPPIRAETRNQAVPQPARSPERETVRGNEGRLERGGRGEDSRGGTRRMQE